ncbi:MAG: hypothetical protein DRO01_05480 [Thermoproteota archaeon]|nr:MAG: hypothetical protein DRO01_05480 [Candidatus Korarchaeota archaeon]
MSKKLLAAIIVCVVALAGLVALYWTSRGEENPKETLQELTGAIAQRRGQGYDVTQAKYYLLSAIYYYRAGDREKALELVDKAREALENAELLASLPEREWSIAESTVEIDRIPTVWDVVPIGSVFVETGGGYLDYPRNDDHWKLSCFIFIAVGQTEDGGEFFYQGRLPLKPEEGLFRPKIYVDGRWIQLDSVFTGPLYFDGGEKFGLPTLYQYDISGRYLQTLSYDEERRLWIHRIKSVEGGEVILDVRVQAVGVPMWIGEWNGSLIIHGVYPRQRDLDLWGGFWDVGFMEGSVNVGGESHEVSGFFVFDRASHRTYSMPPTGNAGAPLAFSCMVICQEDLCVLVSHSENPSPLDIGVSFEHQMRINLFDLNLSVATTDFEFWDDGSIQPSQLRIVGRFDGGWLNLTGYVVEFWPERWAVGRGTWWDGDGLFSWGRSFSRWVGEIVVGNQTIHVDAWGAGEFTRYGQGGEPRPCGVGEGCWGRWGSSSDVGNLTEEGSP